MSVKGTTYLEITQHLKNTVPSIKHIDKYRGQLDDPANFVFPRPAVFVSFGFGQYEGAGNGILTGDKVLRIRTVYENYADSYTGSLNQQKALEYFEFDEAVHVALEGLSGTHFQALTKIADEDDEDHTNLIVQLMEYSMQLVDDSAHDKKEFIKVEPDPNLKVQKVKTEEIPQKEIPENGAIVNIN